MANEGNVELARRLFFEKRPANLNFLLENRYRWMDQYLDGREKVIELGCGAGFSKAFIKNKNLRLTDIEKRPWVDEVIDAMDMKIDDQTIDAFVCSHMAHHVSHPIRFLSSLSRALKPGGVIVLHEINTSWFMKILLRLMRHEGWSYLVDVFDPNAVCTDESDPWAANCAIPELLFEDKARFESAIPSLEIIHDRFVEVLMLPLSGGVIAKSSTIQLPTPLLKLIHLLDKALSWAAPGIFSLGREIVLRKREHNSP